jgi:hypothetical protein
MLYTVIGKISSFATSKSAYSIPLSQTHLGKSLNFFESLAIASVFKGLDSIEPRHVKYCKVRLLSFSTHVSHLWKQLRKLLKNGAVES